MPYQAATYDESKAESVSGPARSARLQQRDEGDVAQAQWPARRAEIVELFDREVYGRRPKVTPKVTWTVASTTNDDDRRRSGHHEEARGTRRQLVVPTADGQHHRVADGPGQREGTGTVVFGGGGDTSVPEGVTPTTVAPLCAPPACACAAVRPGRARGAGARGGPAARGAAPRRVRPRRTSRSSSVAGVTPRSTAAASRPTMAAA